MYENDSLLEIAKELMEKKRKPHTIQAIAKEAFEVKGLKMGEHIDLYSQFINDFMLCGFFICCGEDKKGVKVWDLKSRQKHELIEKDGAFLDDPYGDDEDVVNNELKDEDFFNDSNEMDEQFEEDDEDEKDEDETDDIEEELLLENGYDIDDLDDDIDESFDDEDDITITEKKKK